GSNRGLAHGSGFPRDKGHHQTREPRHDRLLGAWARGGEPRSVRLDRGPQALAMQPSDAVEALGALAHEHRLAIYRLLVERGPDGLAAGLISERVGLVPSSLTFHLQNLQHAGLINQQRASRQLIYSADFDAMNGLVAYLT